VLGVGDVEQILQGGRELRNFEVKGPGTPNDKHMLAKVARAALSIGNLRDGGHVLIGVDDANLAAMSPGLTQSQRADWMSFDDIVKKLATYSDPPLTFDLAELTLSNGAVVVLMEVSEFVDIPHLCARQHDGAGLRKGELYVRSRGAAETVDVSRSVEMREVIELATEKALRRYIEVSRRAGVGLHDAASDPVSADAAFEKQRREAFE
jgi:predicted HTH transcriptional regulator